FDLVSGHTYEMWVRAQGGTWSAKQTFQVAKVTEFKGGYDVNQNRQLTWTPLAKVASYELWIDDLTTGTKNIVPNLVVNHPAQVQQFSAHWVLPASMDVTHNYRLWIRARNAIGLGDWSDSFDFTPALF